MSNLLSISSVFTYIGYILIAILVLLLMVLIHEFGHYIAGKILKFKINEFSVGFGPKLLQKKKKNGELFTLRAIPLGGYCAFDGETEEEQSSPQAFHNQKPWKRLIVLFCGAFFNFLSAIIFSFILLVSNGYDLVEVKNIDQNSMNYQVIQTNDVIYGIEGDSIDFVNDKFFNILIGDNVKEKYATYATNQFGTGELTNEKSFIDEGKIYYQVTSDLTYNINRDGEKLSIVGHINVFYDENGEYAGWSLLSSEDAADTEFEIGNYKYSFWHAVGQSVPFTCKWAWKVLVIFGQLITGQLNLTALGGPVTTIKTIANYTQMSANYLLVLLPLIAVNLAVFNLLPIPALDGCQMIFTTIEWVRKKPIKQSIVNIINNVGLIVLLGFVIVVDILQFVL